MKTVLKGERIYLKIPTMKDVDAIKTHINDKHIVRFMDTIPHPYKRSDGEWYIKHMVQKKLREDTGYLFSIFLKETDELIGGMGICNISKKHKNAEIGYWIGKKFWRNGYARESLNLLLKFGFKKLKFEKMYARTFYHNDASSGLLMKAGFKDEGCLRRHIFHNNKWHDERRFGLLRSEYETKD
ncbi:MAG: GNAT family protein [Candidatus Woesearchaeota archaeon]